MSGPTFTPDQRQFAQSSDGMDILRTLRDTVGKLGRRSKIGSGGDHVSENTPAVGDACGDRTNWAKAVARE